MAQPRVPKLFLVLASWKGCRIATDKDWCDFDTPIHFIYGPSHVLTGFHISVLDPFSIVTSSQVISDITDIYFLRSICELTPHMPSQWYG